MQWHADGAAVLLMAPGRGIQVADIARLADMASVWRLRAKYATVRPTGWRSDPSAAVQWRWAPHGVMIAADCRLWALEQPLD